MIKQFNNKYNNEDIYIIGSGKTMDYLPKSFFDNKVTIGMNRSHKFLESEFLVIKHHEGNGDIPKNVKVLAPEYDCGGWFGMELESHHTVTLPDKDYYFYNHNRQNNGDLSEEQLNKDNHLIAASTVTVTAMHFAYKLGAKNIILCGCDCGTIDTRWNRDDYYADAEPGRSTSAFKVMNKQVTQFANILRRKGINVISINPFINLALEGHVYAKRF